MTQTTKRGLDPATPATQWPEIKRARIEKIETRCDECDFLEEKPYVSILDFQEERVSRGEWAKQLAEKLWYYGQSEDSIIGSVRAELLRQSRKDKGDAEASHTEERVAGR